MKEGAEIPRVPDRITVPSAPAAMSRQIAAVTANRAAIVTYLDAAPRGEAEERMRRSARVVNGMPSDPADRRAALREQLDALRGRAMRCGRRCADSSESSERIASHPSACWWR